MCLFTYRCRSFWPVHDLLVRLLEQKMSQTKQKTRKYCLVPCCTSSSNNSPDKLFFSVPKDGKRKAWLTAMKRDERISLSSISAQYCCEDHFSLKEDMENYWQWHLTKDVKRLKLKEGVLPHIFNCQKSRVLPERKAYLKRTRVALVREAIWDTASSLPSSPSPLRKDQSSSEKILQDNPKLKIISVSGTDTCVDKLKLISDTRTLSDKNNELLTSRVASASVSKEVSDNDTYEVVSRNASASREEVDNISEAVDEKVSTSEEEIASFSEAVIEEASSCEEMDKVSEAVNGNSLASEEEMDNVSEGVNEKYSACEEEVDNFSEADNRNASPYKEETDKQNSKNIFDSVDFCSTNTDAASPSSEDILKQNLEIMTQLYVKSQKKLKRCQEECKFYKKRMTTLEQVIDNLKQINSLTDFSVL